MEYLTVKEVMQLFNCHASQVYMWIRDKVLNSEKVGTGRIIWKDEKYEALKTKRGVE